jgi:HSP20 family protein
MAARQAQTNRNRCSEAERRKEPLTEASFNSFFSSKRDVLDTYFRSGYLFNPFVFGSFTDPSDPIPLWNYTPYTIWPRETVSLSKSRVDWSQTDDGIIMRADLPGLKKDDVDVTVENGRVLKINGQWNQNKRQDDCGEWWKEEYMRRFILPENGDIEQAHASMDDGVLEIRIPKTKKKRPPPTLHSVEVTD